MTSTKTPTDDLHRTLDNPLFEAVDQVGNLLSVGRKSSAKGGHITQELHDYENNIIKKRGSMPHR